MSVTLRVGLIALALVVLFVWLGMHVSRRPLSRLDAEAVYFRAQLTPVALFFTLTGRAPALLASCMIAIAVYSFLHLPLWIPLLITISQLVSQMLVESCKLVFRRMRPDYWLVGREAGHSYPSGHATTAVVFFIGWAVVIAFTALPGSEKSILMGVFTVWALGIMWSRLALGAHYFSDVCGGALFGTAWLLMAFDISSHFYGILR